MVTLNISPDSAEDIDMRKRKIEAAFFPRFKRILDNIAQDAGALYRARGFVDAEELARNYLPEFTKELRDTYRRTIKEFGFSIRDSLNSKSAFNFRITVLKALLDLSLRNKQEILDSNLSPKVEQLNNEYMLALLLFVANQSEKQATLIAETNVNQINQAVVSSTAAVHAEITALENQRQAIQIQILQETDSVERERLSAGMRRLDSSIFSLREALSLSIAIEITRTLRKKSPARAELIAEQNVGIAESDSRHTEALLVSSIVLVTASGDPLEVEQEWDATLDSRTRPAHAAANGQVRKVNQTFSVGGEELRYPRDPNGSSSNTIRCRCITKYLVP